MLFLSQLLGRREDGARESLLIIFHLSLCNIRIFHHYSLLLRKKSLSALGKIHLPLRYAEWHLTELHGKTLSHVQVAPYTPPEADEVDIKSQAWTVTPVDWVLQQTSHFNWLKHPIVLGYDVAGEVAKDYPA